MADMYAEITAAGEDITRLSGLRGSIQGYEYETTRGAGTDRACAGAITSTSSSRTLRTRVD